jgi:hypothetical protein
VLRWLGKSFNSILAEARRLVMKGLIRSSGIRSTSGQESPGQCHTGCFHRLPCSSPLWLR